MIIGLKVIQRNVSSHMSFYKNHHIFVVNVFYVLRTSGMFSKVVHLVITVKRVIIFRSLNIKRKSKLIMVLVYD